MKKINISKCNKDCCLHCGTNYCRFVEQLQQLKQENEELKDILFRIKLISNLHNSALSKDIKDIIGE